MKDFKKNIIKSSTELKLRPYRKSPVETECLFGEEVQVLKENLNWLKCKAKIDGYIGWIKKKDTDFFEKKNYRVVTPRSLIYTSDSIKSNVIKHIPMGSKLTVLNSENEWTEIKLNKNSFFKKGYVPTKQIRKINHIEKDWVKTAERLIGIPYKWGGRDTIGIDCSALIQLSLETITIKFPRNSKDQEIFNVGSLFDYNILSRGSIIFWNGHVGVMRNDEELLHASGYHKMVTSEKLKIAEKRIKPDFGPIKKVNNDFLKFIN